MGFENKLSASIPSMKRYLEKISKEMVLSGSWSLCTLNLSRCCTPVTVGSPWCFQNGRQNKDTVLDSCFHQRKVERREGEEQDRAQFTDMGQVASSKTEG